MGLFVFVLVISLQINSVLVTDQHPHPIGYMLTIDSVVRRVVQASENTVDRGQPPKIVETPQTTSSEPAKSETQTESNNQPQQMKKKLPLKEFLPSEEIEADHAVDFPVDI